ncbi:alpha-2-macroglobulin family protein [Roseomonas eburnea]|uniref:Alpha-2-macroglobulin family protein n=1 Tax=Neoroseomonas eburnea TaxID=1346889 RepID=A0A9X9X9U7_9PROT|nr:alpha-2-macroglobulin [Neoroseomonas eburnea]MBR0680483.1 alpha-2-macroglobulin family protein [Neoroseomonas eburnea]
MRLIRLLLLLAFALPGLAAAQTFDLPGLGRDTSAYQQEMQRRFPAGGNPQQRLAAEQRAGQAEGRRDYAAAAAAWEERIGLGQPNGDHWLALAQAQLNRTPPNNQRALQAAWRAFQLAPYGEPEIAPLLVIAEALRRMDRPVQQIEALEAILERMDSPEHRQRLETARRAAGMLVRRVTTEPDADPARACLAFTNAPARRTDWQPGDWIRADPPIPSLAIEREGDLLCVAGLPWGASTRLILRAGLPGEDRQNLRQETAVAIAMPNRDANIAFDTRAFILPRGQEARIGVATVNVTNMTMRLVRVAERNLVPLRRDWTPGEALESWSASSISEDMGRILWEGRAELQRVEPNRTHRSILPLPDVLRSAGPGAYLLVLRQDDSRRGESRTAALPFFVTDIGLTAWRGADGLAVQARSLQSATATGDLRVMLMARNNEILAETRTGADGLARFPVALLRGTGPLAPVAVHAETADDIAALSLEAASFDLSDRGATGQPHPGPVDAFLWLDRGIFRPGETVNAAALIRDPAGRPLDLPIRLRLRRPNGQIAQEIVPPRQDGGAIYWPLRLSAGAPFGLWTLEALTDPDAPPVGRTTFRVDAFVPERLEVTAGPVPGPLVPGARGLAVPVTARFLYGAPGSGLSGQAEMRLLHDPEPFEAWRGWRFGLAQEQFAPDLITFEVPETDDQGRTTLTLALPQAPDTTRPVRGEVTVSVSEPGGRETRTRFAVPVRARGTLVAVKPAFENDAIDAGAEAAFDIAAVSPEGRAVPATLRVRLVRERPNWRIVVRGSIARWETVWRDEPVDAQEIRVTAQQPMRFARTLPFGRYRLEVSDAGGLGITSIRFRSGWAGVESAEIPDRVDVAADRRAYAPGEAARIRITPPFAGRASVAVLTDRLVSLREIEVAEGGTDVDVPVDAAWGPGAYVAVTVFRPGETRSGQPGRGLGLAWVGIDPAPRTLAVTIDTPPLLRPRQRAEVPVRVANAGGPVLLTLAAVDEGILRLTSFANPDPAAHLLGRRRLGVDIRDDYGRLIAPAEGELALLRQGGDEDAAADAIQPPQRLVSLFSGVVRAGPDGVAMVPLDIPDFAGELRLMVVAWEGTRVGAAAKPVTVRDQVVAEALLPRFLAPGDEARLSVLLHNIELPQGEIAAELTATGGLAIAGPTRLAAALATGARAQPFTTLRATEGGEGVLRLAVTGPNGFRVDRESRITIRSSRARVTEVAGVELPPGVELPFNPPISRFVQNAWRATASFGAAVRYDVSGMLRAVEDFPLYCLEQSASRALALSAGITEEGDPDRAIRLQRAVDAILDRQRFDGSFSMWSASGEAQQWLTPYAVEALVRARTAGATVPEGALREALRFLDDAIEDTSADTPEERAAQAYRLHALALAGQPRLGAARRLMENLNELPTQLSRAQLAATFARGGDTVRAEQAFAAALAATGRRFWYYDYGSAPRDALATALLLRESGLMPDRLSQVLNTLPGAAFTPLRSSTQEQAWAVLAAQVLGQGMRAATVAVNGSALPPRPVVATPISGPGVARNLGSAPVWQSVSINGIPRDPLPAAREGFRVTRRFFALDGQPLDLDRLTQNTSFVLLIELRAETNERHEAMVIHGLPAGWEIASRLPAGDIAGMPWLGTLTEVDSQPALDDRYAAAVTLTPQRPFARLAVRLRAVTAGAFELPGGEAQDMYRPGIFARQNTARITVLPGN